ncbi:MAG: histidine phosphatase family protein [Nitrososphaeria archaeon]|nr:histidine phosphatase family protein [Nitrososphaeria archaeon]
MNVILLIRHGESESNIKHLISHDIESYPLTEKGLEQSKILGNELKKLKIDIIYSSPVLRCRQTAQIISEYLKCPIIYDERVKERFFGKFNNKRIDPLDWKTFLIDEASKKCVEEWDELYLRIYDLIKNVKGKSTIIVTHYDLIRAFIAKQLGLEDELSAWGIVIPNASLTVVLNKNNDYKVKAIGIPPVEELISKTICDLMSNSIQP